MLENENKREQIEQALKGQRAGYIEVRLEESESSGIVYRGRELEDVSWSASVGGCVRAWVQGGWGFVSFEDLDRLREKVELAVQQAGLVSGADGTIIQAGPVVDIVKEDRKGVKDPSSLSMSQKKALLDEYNQVMWSTPHIQTSNIGYADGKKRVVFANSEGSYIEQSRVDVGLRVSAIARDGGEVQQVALSIGSRGDFSQIEGLHGQIAATARRTVELLSAPRVRGGEYPVVLDPVLAGVFAHEAFGHLSESDFLYQNDRLREIMVLGKRFGNPGLNIVDGAAVPNLRGSYRYDDEGIPATRTYLIKNGILAGRLHSRETAASMGEKPTGNARAISYRYPPIVRMTNTFIEPGNASFEDMIADIKEGVYAKNWYGGTTSMEMFTFSAGECYLIRNGKVAELIKPVTLAGNVFATLGYVDAIGNDLKMSQGGGCGKGEQMPLPVSDGSPHIRISQCLVGGKQ